MCPWSSYSKSFVSVAGMFTNTSCPTTADPVLNANPPGPYCYTCSRAPTQAPTSKPIGSSIRKCMRKLKKNCNCGLVFRGSPCMKNTVKKDCKTNGNRKQFMKDVRYAYMQVYCRKSPYFQLVEQELLETSP